ncbi:ribosome biogenesis protein SLX9 homolog isoform X3 [Kogia breviceps]|uniref:ribosome biogenesis protein SLX9 homolog isoform X3 n=1 Tax=Kogia breviceps TaxID=27615 RepID=UPI0034D25FB4
MLRCQGQGCFAQEGEAEAEAREVAAETLMQNNQQINYHRFRQFPWSKVCTQASELEFSTSHTVEITHLKIEAARLAEQRREAERRRRATVVVGDLQPLRDALPELRGLETAGQRCVPVKFGEESASPSSLVMPTASLGTARPLLGRPRGPGQPSRAGRARHRGSGSSRRKGRGFRSCWPARPTEPTPCRSPGSSWPSRCGWRVAGSPDATWGRPRGGAQGPNSAVVALLRQPLSNGAAVLGTGGSTGVRQAVDVVVL